MGIVSTYINILKLRRASQIAFILLRQSIKIVFSGIISIPKKKKIFFTQKKVKSTPERLRIAIEQLGPTYIKFGQILSDRTEILSDRYSNELKKLQSNVDFFSTSEAIKLIEEELDGNICDLFETFDTVPLAAASIGQVYRARLRTSEEVIVKIQRPNIENKVKVDIYLMKYIATRIVKSNPQLASLNLLGIVEEFSQTITKEMDYTNEANNIKLFEKLFLDDKTIKIPKVFDLYTTKKVITIEYIDGVEPLDESILLEHNLSPCIVANNGAKAIFKMVLEYGIFHGDPHAGNILIMKDNTIAFIDFGMIGILRSREIDFLADFTYGYSKQDQNLLCKAILELCQIEFFEQKEDMLFDLRMMQLRNTDIGTLDIKNFSNTLHSSLNIIIKYKLKIPSGIYMLVKTLITLQKFADNLNTQIDMDSIILPYSKQIRDKRFSPRAVATKIYDIINSYTNLVATAPGDISEILSKLKTGRIKHDINIHGEKTFIQTTKKISLRISYVILLIGLFIGSSILIVMEYELKFGLLILYSTSLLILFLLIKWLFRSR